jgi:peptide/nickel transport system substrate-binding protein
VRNANGTGPFRLDRYRARRARAARSAPALVGPRRPSATAMSTSASFVSIRSDATRLAALASGEVDLVLDPPFQDVERLKQRSEDHAAADHRPRQQYFTFDQSRDELKAATSRAAIRSRTLRVRRAVYAGAQHRADHAEGAARPGTCRPAPSCRRWSTAPARTRQAPGYDPAQGQGAAGRGRLPERLRRSRSTASTSPGARRSARRDGDADAGRHPHHAAQRRRPTSSSPSSARRTASFIEFGWTPTPTPGPR